MEDRRRPSTDGVENCDAICEEIDATSNPAGEASHLKLTARPCAETASRKSAVPMNWTHACLV